jgi:putative membrane protein
VLWELGLLNRFWDVSVDDPAASPGLVRSLIQFARSGNAALLEYILLAFAGLALLLVLIRLLSMAWAAIRLHDFRLTRVGDDLRTEFGLITHEMATIPLDRVQTLTIVESPLHRLLKRVSVRVETAGGGGAPRQGGSPSEREWLAPILRRGRIGDLVHHVIPGVDVAAVEWRPVHPRAFRRAVKPALLRAAVLPAILILPLGAWAALVLAITVPLAVLGARKRVQYLGWATTEHAALFRSGWLRRTITLARTSKIQAVTLVESPFDRRTAMAQVRVDTAGANERSHRVRIPYLPREAAHELHRSLLDRAANAAFHW